MHIGIMYDTGEESHIVWTCGQVEGYPSKRHLAVCMVTLRGKDHEEATSPGIPRQWLDDVKG